MQHIDLKPAVARWLSACTAASQQEGPGFDSRMGRCWSWGVSSPQCSGGLSPGPFCVEFACSPRVHTGFPPLRTPTEKHAEEQNTLLPVPASEELKATALSVP